MISLAQVVAAMAVGVLLPVMGLLVLEVRRTRQSGAEAASRASPPEPERVVDDDARDPVVEAVAQLAAAQFELLGHTDSEAQATPHRHLTLIPTSRGPADPARAPAAKKRSGNSRCGPGCTAEHPEPVGRPPHTVTRDRPREAPAGPWV